MDMIERAARAAYNSVAPNMVGFEWPEVCTSVTADEFRAAARAALLAIREPDEGMIEAGIQESCAAWCIDQCNEFIPGIWQAMIDQALKG